MAVLSKYPIDDRRGAHVPALPLEGHARRAAAGRPGHRGAGRLVLARGARRRSACRASRTGTCRSSVGGTTVHVLAVAPDAADVRRRRGPQRPAQPRRDPVLGRLRRRPGTASRYIYDDEGGRGGLQPGESFVIARRPERRPARRRLASTARSTSCSTTRASPTRCRRPAGAVEAAALQGGANLTHEGDPALRHRRLRRHRAGQPARRLRAAVARPARCATRACSGRCRPTRSRGSRASSRSRRSDHRLVWVDLRVHP